MMSDFVHLISNSVLSILEKVQVEQLKWHEVIKKKAVKFGFFFFKDMFSSFSLKYKGWEKEKLWRVSLPTF